ncbi:hypothetical protein OHD62_30990 [Mesorhizobium sp. YC-39]|uniref:hypothetical protein n=1 Tax=unclassified Mesorhizobium TaxID=325217 RepID=UPI0021E787CD|nr:MULTISPECIES: hypothetical protein [unclassified Mesorhizobium]MCV3211092.1 hypothetical protein [Mesorhizobium sp. YC-2]MCV3232817.1 hypothetical protein [Mesorhizobium sp. YC-39]
MGGREAIRGFSIQTLAVVLDALNPKNDGWSAVTIEPDTDNDKVDILWEFPDLKRAQQVKSSQNQIGKAAVESWCSDLKASKSANEYQLILAGPIAQAVIDEAPFDGVSVPTPLAIDTVALIEQAITKLDRYLQSQGIEGVPLSVRESLVTLVAGNLIDGAISGRRFTRDEFDGQLQRWITAAYPEAIRARLSANCEVLWSQLELHRQRLAVETAYALVLPLTVVNGGLTVAVVEWFYLTVSCDGREMRYVPVEFLQGDQKTLSMTQGPKFAPFAVSPNSSWEKRIAFLPQIKPGFATDRWPQGLHLLSLYVKFASAAQPRLVKKYEFLVTSEHSAVPHDSALWYGLLKIDPF